MKTNITINLFGQLYHIDEDAYELLKKYEDNMKRYFSNREGGEEIIDDIEHRVAELFTELKAKGIEAINIAHVEEIIQRIGNPEQISEEEAGMATESSVEDPTTENSSSAQGNAAERGTSSSYNAVPRRLYRDISHSMLGGVASGLSHYFGISDPVFIRLLWVVLFFLPYCPAILIYIILWIIIPAAVTPEDQLKMDGKPVNPQTLNEEIINSSQKKTENGTSTESTGVIHRIFDAFFSLCAIAVKVIVLFCLGIFIMVVCSLLFVLLFFTFGLTPAIFLSYNLISAETSMIINTIFAHGWQLWALFITGSIALGLPLYVLNRRIFHHSRPASSTGKRIVIFVTWMLSLIISILFVTSMVFNVHTEIDEQKRLQHTRNGICLYGRSWGILDEGNWNVVNLENAQPFVYSHCKNLFRKDTDQSYIRVRNSGDDFAMKGTLVREVYPEAGRYRLEAIVNSKGEGCYLFTQSNESATPVFTLIPFKDKSNYQIANMSWRESQTTHYFKNATDSIGWGLVQKNSKDKDWCFVTSKEFVHHGGKLKYGVTNDTEFTQHPWNGEGFDLYEIVLTKIDDELDSQPL